MKPLPRPPPFRRYIYISKSTIATLLPQVPKQFLRRHGVVDYLKEVTIGSTVGKVSFSPSHSPDALGVRAINAIEDYVRSSEYWGPLGMGARFIIDERLPTRIVLGGSINDEDRSLYPAVNAPHLMIASTNSAKQALLLARGSMTSLVGSADNAKASEQWVPGSFPMSVQDLAFGKHASEVAVFFSETMPLRASIFAIPHETFSAARSPFSGYPGGRVETELFLATVLYVAV